MVIACQCLAVVDFRIYLPTNLHAFKMHISALHHPKRTTIRHVLLNDEELVVVYLYLGSTSTYVQYLPREYINYKQLDTQRDAKRRGMGAELQQ